MKKWNILLIILLAVQAGLITTSWTARRNLDAFTPDQPLLDFALPAVDTIEIQGPDQARVVLRKKDGTWLLPDYFQAPAEQKNVENLLDKLQAMKKTWPVATTPEAARRFKVATDSFERRILLKEGDKTLAELFVGTSPSFRKVHVRLPDSSEIMNQEFAVYEAPVKPEQWLDKRLTALERENIESLTLNGVQLVRRDTKFTLKDLAEGETVNSKAIDRLVDQLTNLQVEGVAGREDKPGYGLDKPALVCTIGLKSGAKKIWKFGRVKEKDQEKWFLKTSDQDLIFTVASWRVKPLLKAGREQLITKAEKTTTDPAAAVKQSSPE